MPRGEDETLLLGSSRLEQRFTDSGTSTTPNLFVIRMATEQPKAAKEDAPKLVKEDAKIDLFEDDDEFEEFEIDQEWEVKEEGKEVTQQWEDDWDDDDVNDDFSLQLRRELEKNNTQKS